MKTSPNGRRLLTQREGIELKAYKDTVGVWTIGVGHTSAAGPPKVTKGLTITREESDAIFARDLVTYEAAVNAAVTVPISQGEFDALVSLCYNIGTGGFKKSTIVRRLNAGDREGAAEAFMMWRKPPEIIGRRKGEQKQFINAGPPKAKVARLLAPVEEPLDADVGTGGDGDPPSLNVQPVTASYSVDVENIQRQLIRVGYHEVGGIDGIWGGMTVAGIAAFKNDRGLKGEPVIDAALKAELSKAIAEGWSRPIAPERANITAAKVAAETPAAKQTWRQWAVAKWTTFTAFLLAAFNGVSSQFKGLSDYVEPVRDLFADVPGWLWLLGIGGAAALVWLSSRRATEAIVDDKRTGKLS